MANIKTAISVEKPLFEELCALSREMEVSRSYLFSLAAREFIQRHKSKKLLAAIDSAYKDLPGPEEEKLEKQLRSKHLELVKDQW
jgi:hypothetical protein